MIKKWKGKKFFINKSKEIIFEGDYLNGQKKCKGKEYRDNKLKFEGECMGNKKLGKMKEYYYNKSYYEESYNTYKYSINEVKYINDERSGKGKE